MYNTKAKHIVLEIPKNGSRSLITASSHATGKRYMKCLGHRSLYRILRDMETEVSQKGKPRKDTPLPVIAVIRNPLNRFISQVNAYCHNKNTNLDEAMKACIEQSNVIFTPQYSYVSDPEFDKYCLSLYLYPMTRMRKAQEHILNKKMDFVYHSNKGDYRKYPLIAIQNHPKFYDAMKIYDPDWSLHEFALLSKF